MSDFVEYICPFCGERDFDQIGLKHHLLTYCEVFANTETLAQERERKTNEH